MARTLKELYGLREMAITVPDEDVASLRKVIQKAILNGDLPGEAMAWIPRKAKGTPAKGTPEVEPKAEPSSPPEKKAKRSRAKEKEPEAPPRQPIPVDPAVKADLDRSQSAWDQLGKKVGEPGVPMKSKVRSEPMKGPEFDPTGIHPDFGDDMPDLPTPKSANVDLKKGGDPDAPDWAAGAKKPGMLSRLFGRGKKGPQRFDANPFEFEPQAPATGPKPQWPDLSRFIGGDDDGGPEPSPGKDALDDLEDFLKKNPSRRGTGDDAMKDLEWDLKRSRGKR